MIEKSTFGNSLHESSRVVFGAASLSDGDRERAARAFSWLEHYGVNHIDTSVSYGGADACIGELIEKRRNDYFLAGKIDARTYSEASKELDTSLSDLRTDHFDLLQMHELVRWDDVERFLGGDGAAGLLLRAKERGLARSVGATAHGFEAPVLLKRCVESLPLDSVLLPYNYLLSTDEEYRQAFGELRELCRRRGIGVLTIKSVLRSPWDDVPRTRTTWYRPLEDQKDIDRAVWWLLGHEELFLCSVGDVDLLPKVLDAADRYSSPPSNEQMEEMRAQLDMRMPQQDGWPRM